ncbi:MAG TPA: DUF4394 domain-containing protein, partial [Pyrinomonadaceae bacterium]|nr:DUF4394 domain-containing protein [Pyrinomonadaceae bacterium]
MNMNIGKSFLSGLSRKTFYLMTLFTLLALAAVGFFVVPSISNSGTASAAKVEAGAGQKVTAEMLRWALDFRSGTEYRVFAGEGISKKGNSVIEGETSEANRDSENGARIRKDLGDAFSIMNELPATKVAEFGSGSYKAGVYSAPSGRLSGEMILDAGNDPNAIFIFKVGAALRTESDLHFSLINGAQPQNIFFIAKGTATVGENVDFKGSILAEETISVGAGAKVTGRTISLGGEVKLTDAAVSGATGVLEICKEAVEAGLTVYGLTTNNILFSFNSNTPNNVNVIGPIFGTGGAAIVGIDFRPATSFIIIEPEGPILGVLYGVGSDNNLYTINQFTGGATLVGPLGIALAGTNFGVDFNPVTDLLRVVSDTGQNLSVNPNTGAATAQAGLNSTAQNPELGISGAAYSNNRQGATTTTLYDIDTDADTLVTQVPATGVITTVGSLGINATAVNGFDISEVNNTALAAITTVPAGETG